MGSVDGFAWRRSGPLLPSVAHLLARAGNDPSRAADIVAEAAAADLSTRRKQVEIASLTNPRARIHAHYIHLHIYIYIYT